MSNPFLIWAISIDNNDSNVIRTLACWQKITETINESGIVKQVYQPFLRGSSQGHHQRYRSRQFRSSVLLDPQDFPIPHSPQKQKPPELIRMAMELEKLVWQPLHLILPSQTLHEGPKQESDLYKMSGNPFLRSKSVTWSSKLKKSCPDSSTKRRKLPCREH